VNEIFAKGIDDLVQKDNAGHGNGTGRRICNILGVKKSIMRNDSPWERLSTASVLKGY
jgi:hypothetical protein